jgi:glycosyltransferase involved in cell wall biosynthesis
MASPLLSIIIPAHNEERRLPQTLEQVVHFAASQSFETEVLVVENASTDRTLEVGNEYSSRHPMVRVMHEDLPGKGRAVQKGMLAAEGAYRFFADADFSMPPEEIVRFIPPLVDVPVAIASREAPGAVRYNEPFYRHITGRVFNSLIRILVLPALNDTQCGFKMFRADVAEDLFRHQTLMGWSFDVELLYIASCRGYPILEIPIPWYFNPESKVNVFRDSWRMFLDLLAIRRNGRKGLYD